MTSSIFHTRKISRASAPNLPSARPRVYAHFAMTADGKTSTRNQTPSLFTSARDKARLQEVRAGADAVMVGRGTLESDSMTMGISREDLRAARLARGLPPVPVRVVLSNSGKLDPAGKAFQYTDSPLVVFSTQRMPLALRAKIVRRAELFLFEGDVDVRECLQILGRDFGVKKIVCEGGGTLLRTLAEADLLDGLYATMAPVLFGGRHAPTLTGLPGGFLNPIRKFRLREMQVLDGECFLEFAAA